MTTAPSPDTELTLQEAADELGVHYMTAYRYVRLGMLEAHKRGRSWVVSREDLEAFRTAPAPDGGASDTDTGVAWDERLVRRMLAADDAGAWKVVEAALASGMEPRAVYLDVITPALRSVGDRWADGSIDIADEHAASQIARRVVARLAPRMTSRGLRRGTIVMGSTSTEMHDLPISIVADLFRSLHFEVIDLGGNLPPESFARAVASANDVVAVGIGITAPDQHAEIARTIAALRAVTDVPILVGGRGIAKDEALSLGADAAATTGHEAIEAIEHITNRTWSRSG